MPFYKPRFSRREKGKKKLDDASKSSQDTPASSKPGSPPPSRDVDPRVELMGNGLCPPGTMWLGRHCTASGTSRLFLDTCHPSPHAQWGACPLASFCVQEPPLGPPESLKSTIACKQIDLDHPDALGLGVVLQSGVEVLKPERDGQLVALRVPITVLEDVGPSAGVRAALVLHWTDQPGVTEFRQNAHGEYVHAQWFTGTVSRQPSKVDRASSSRADEPAPTGKPAKEAAPIVAADPAPEPEQIAEQVSQEQPIEVCSTSQRPATEEPYTPLLPPHQPFWPFTDGSWASQFAYEYDRQTSLVPEPASQYYPPSAELVSAYDYANDKEYADRLPPPEWGNDGRQVERDFFGFEYAKEYPAANAPTACIPMRRDTQLTRGDTVTFEALVNIPLAALFFYLVLFYSFSGCKDCPK